MSDLEILRAANLESLAGVTHGFFTRAGGVSEGLYAGLNCGPGSGDDPARVAENRGRVRDALGAVALLSCHQVHGADVLTVTAPWDDASRPNADAMVTNRPGLALGILTADCVPVLFADEAAGVVGAAHGGWQGVLKGVIAATVAAMTALGARPATTAAAIGPAIAQASYEVGPELRDSFLAADPATDRFFAANERGRFQFDLEGLVAARLSDEGVGAVDRLGLDTYADSRRFFSFRRATHAGEADYGRQISAVLLSP